MVDSVGLLDLNLGPEDLPMDDLEQVRLFGGYAGWGAGQLDEEVKEEAWFVVTADPDDPFSDDPESLWRRVLQRQHGRLAMFAYQPPDPSVN
jgi:putative transcriptional regulator